MILHTLLFGLVLLALWLILFRHQPRGRQLLRRYPLLLSLFSLSLFGCEVGDINSSDSADVITDNSVDNSQHGISSCTEGSTFVCAETGPESFVQTEECINVNGSPVILNGPEPISGELFDACVQSETAVIETFEPDGSTTTDEIPIFPNGTAIPTIPQ